MPPDRILLRFLPVKRLELLLSPVTKVFYITEPSYQILYGWDLSSTESLFIVMTKLTGFNLRVSNIVKVLVIVFNL